MNEAIQPPCPHCKGVHFSIYNSERCAIRHQIANELATYDQQESARKSAVAAKKKPVETPEQAKAKGWKYWLRYCDKFRYSVTGNKL